MGKQAENSIKCKLCPVCNGLGCMGEMPGMGGPANSINFINNYEDWNTRPAITGDLPRIRLAPMTGAVQNVGWEDEESFYYALLKASVDAGINLSIGDGTPDEKLYFGIDALKKLKKTGAVFIKPYEQKKILERFEISNEVMEIAGIDIDSYNIVTMRNLAHLEKKTAKDLIEIKNKLKVPFAVKGIFFNGDIDLLKEVKPDIAVISNHGGRIETRQGSTADFLDKYGQILQRYVGEVWVDGGLRTKKHFQVAKSLGASEVLLGRPCITAILKDRQNGMKKMIDKIRL